MRVQTKLVSLMLLLSAIFIAGRYFFQIFEDKRINIIFQQDIKEKNFYLDKLIKLKGESLETLAFDYTYWDEMVNFIHSNNMRWAKRNMDENVLKSYKTDAIWIYKTDLTQAYYINSETASGLKEFFLPINTINDIFAKNRFCYFFVNTKAGLMEIRGSTIHPGSDPQRITPPNGYFFTGRLWNKEYIDELARLVGGEVKISAIKQDLPSPKTFLKSNVAILSRELCDWQGKPTAYLYVKTESKQLESYKLFSRHAAMLFVVFLTAVLILVTVFLATSVSSPLLMITQSLKTGKSSDLDGLLDKDVGEFGDIARLIAKFFSQQEQLIQAEKLGAVGQLASGVAHEVRNPLGIILQGVNYLEQKMLPAQKDISETLAMLKDSVTRADKIINDLFDFSKAAAPGLQPEDINSIVEVSLSLLKARFKLDNIDIVMETKKDIPKVMADKNKLEQVFINILLNAVQAMPSGGRIVIRSYEKRLEQIGDGVGRRDRDKFKVGEQAVIVEVEDTGSGILPENLAKVFDPFFTTKGPRAGAGLGLSITQNIITMHKGLINIESRQGKGTKVIITFKIANP